ncbi:reverse transcriptase [Gossypium australe]|uniref:Reverse transcriptase n=1 Tax=Gossypium australe TaxID=47621 RepID=A0A5B6V0Y9_9ROSI|nr:reverse transcriptase [Gossypium australe]
MKRLRHQIEAAIEEGSWEPLLLSRIGLGHRVNCQRTHFILDKVRTRLNGWEVRELSLAGRLTLVKSMLLTISNDFMTATKIPISVCNEIKKLARGFLWGSIFFERKSSLVNWEIYCKPREYGSLGIRILQDQNKLFLMKLGYKLVANIEELWVQILRNKYKVHKILLDYIHRSNYSNIWRSIANIWNEVKKGSIGQWVMIFRRLDDLINTQVTISSLSRLPTVQWIIWNIFFQKGEWLTFFSIMSWFLRKSQNDFIFKQISGSSQSLLTSAEAWTRSLSVKGESDNWSCNSTTKANGWIKVNVDSSMSTTRPKATIEGVVRGPNGGWMGGFEMMIGLSDIFQVEARALFEGLKFAWAQGFCQVEIESDNALLIAVIQNGLAASSKYNKIRQIYAWCFKRWDVKFCQIMTDNNKVANRIAKKARGEMK